jgi:putative FmdB family regulatory protein
LLKDVEWVTVPVYEYEPADHDCHICEGRFSTIQAIGDDPLQFCPTCGLECRRVISKASIKVSSGKLHSRADKQGFTTFKRAEKGVWEKTGGEGPDYLVGSKEDIAAVEAEKASPKKVIDLDKGD